MMVISSETSEEIAFLGQTGAGKTSLINTLFDLDWFIDAAVASTKKLHRHTGKISKRISNSDKLWTVTDTPGVGESEVADEAYFSMLCEVFCSCKTLVWVVQADNRAYSEDQLALLRLTTTKTTLSRVKCCVLVNQIDKIYPENWDLHNNQPSPEQQPIIEEKLEVVYSRFHKYLPVYKKHIFPISAQKVYGFEKFISFISQH